MLELIYVSKYWISELQQKQRVSEPKFDADN
jgi:hypothetical protein